jgi:hypothetical protein
MKNLTSKIGEFKMAPIQKENVDYHENSYNNFDYISVTYMVGIGGIFRKMRVPTREVQTPNADFVETRCTGRADFFVIRYSGGVNFEKGNAV